MLLLYYTVQYTRLTDVLTTTTYNVIIYLNSYLSWTMKINFPG